MFGPGVDEHLLSFVIFLPLATAVGLLLANVAASFLLHNDGLPPTIWRAVCLGSAVLTFLLSVVFVWGRFDPERGGYQLVAHASWLPEWGIHYFVGVDGISLVLVMLTTFLMPVAMLAAWRDVDRSFRTWAFFMLALESLMLGAFTALNLFLFYLFFELMLVPMYFLIGIWGGPRRVYAATKFFLFTLAGSLLLLVALLVLAGLNAEQGGALNFDFASIPGLRGLQPGLPLGETAVPVASGPGIPWWQTQAWLFVAFALAFGIQVPVVPFHTWLPDAHVEAPTSGSVVLAGILLKVGVYGFVRFALPLFPVAAVELAPAMLGLAVVGILYGSLVAMVQRDVKRLVAYSSIAHLGFAMLGLFALNLHGVTGSVVQLLSHGLATGALFVLVGFIYERRQTREISEFGGLAKPMPVFAASLGIVVMASIGVPALAGFVGEFLILLGAFAAHRGAAVLATGGVVLGAAYMLWMFRRVVFGPLDKPENRGLIDLDLRERLVVAALILPLLWIGLHPNPVLRRIEPSVSLILQQMELRQTHTAVAPLAPAPSGGEASAG